MEREFIEVKLTRLDFDLIIEALRYSAHACDVPETSYEYRLAEELKKLYSKVK